MRVAFGQLGDDDRELLELRVHAGLSADEVGRLLGKRPGAVRMAQARALQRLRANLEAVARWMTTSWPSNWHVCSTPVRPPLPAAGRRAAGRGRIGPHRRPPDPYDTAAVCGSLPPRRSSPCCGGVALARSLGDDDAIEGAVEYDGPMGGPAGEPIAAELRIVATGTGRIVELDTDDLPILPTGEFYELWFVGPGDTAGSPNRISAGTFHPDPDGRSDVQFLAAVNPALFPVVEVTAEPGDGDPRPTGPVVLRATVA